MVTVVLPALIPLYSRAQNAVPVATDAQVKELCGACHAVPPPDTFPRKKWAREVAQGYQFFAGSTLKIAAPPQAAVVRWYEKRAPENIATMPVGTPTRPMPIHFQRLDFGPAVTPKRTVGISNVQLVHLFDPKRLDVLAADVNSGDIIVLSPYKPNAQIKRIAKVEHPAHVEVVDLDKDGIPDILVADIGLFLPADARLGRILWLRGRGDGTFDPPKTLLSGIGRVVDVQAGDFDGDGKLDLAVAEFGHHKFGSVIALMNRTTDWAHPIFEPHQIDKVTGSIHVPICDLNGDGKLDIVAVQAQEHEQVVAYLGRGDGSFERHVIYQAPHPDYGSSGIQIVDMNGDGKLDVLYTNGDTYDDHSLLRTDQGVQWLENRGTFPFVHHSITKMYGSYRALAYNFEGNGKQDIVAVSDIIPSKEPPGRAIDGFDSVIFLRQTAGGTYERYPLEKGACDHFTCAVGDIYGDGKLDIVVGSFVWNTKPTPGKLKYPITIFRNLGEQHVAEVPKR
jgi:hypothetical protein